MSERIASLAAAVFAAYARNAGHAPSDHYNRAAAEQWMTQALVEFGVGELLDAAQTYFDRYCVDEADDWFDEDEQHGEETGCSRPQHADANRLRRALRCIGPA